MSFFSRYASVDLSSYAGLHEKRADDGGENGDDELDDGLPAFDVLEHS